MKKKIIFAVCLVITIFGLHSCANNGNNGESNTENNTKSDKASNNDDSYSEITYAITHEDFTKFEVTLYSDGTGFVAYAKRRGGERGEVDCRWYNNYASYRNQKAAMYLVYITIDNMDESQAIRVGTNEAYSWCSVFSPYEEAQKVGRLTIGEPDCKKNFCKIIRKK